MKTTGLKSKIITVYVSSEGSGILFMRGGGGGGGAYYVGKESWGGTSLLVSIGIDGTWIKIQE